MTLNDMEIFDANLRHAKTLLDVYKLNWESWTRHLGVIDTQKVIDYTEAMEKEAEGKCPHCNGRGYMGALGKCWVCEGTGRK